MEDNIEKKKVVEDIRSEIEASKGTYIWSDYVNALKLISQVVFTRSSGFILELIQNAEDAGLGLESPGMFEIRINKERVKVIHNARPFNENDVQALCGIRSSKKPEKGTLGYLGIGFKSVFKVTDCPEVYSDGFQFKFDRNAWSDQSNTPWHVIPIWLYEPSEIMDSERTTFIIPFRDETYYPILLQEVKKLRTELYLFLRWLKKIEVADEISGQKWMLENAGDNEEGITILKHDSQQQRFKFFRRLIEKIPDWVKQDRLTQEYRANVTQRGIAIAFSLDKEGNLAPIEAGAMWGGVYSFLPLGEAKSGAKFPIQADFLVQPGRDAINYEAKWNHWLIEEMTKLCKEGIEYFKNHDRWKYQFLPAFEFTKSKGLESYDKLFGPKLIEPIEKFLEEDDCIPTIDGSWAKPKQTVRLSENPSASENLLNMGVLKEEEIASVMGGHPNLKLSAPDFKDRFSVPLIRIVDRRDLLSNEAFLQKKSQQSDAPGWFRSLYLWLSKHPFYETYKSGRSDIRNVKGYHGLNIILTSDGKLLKGGDVLLPDLPPSDPILKDLADTLQKSKSVLHPDILGAAKDEAEQKSLRGFLTGLTGVQILDSKTVCKEALLPKILTNAPKPALDELLKYTTYCQQILGKEIDKGLEFWILTKHGDIRAAKEVFFPSEFKPEQDWETHQQYVPGLSFISPRYIESIANDDQLKAWREFFKAGVAKEIPDNGVEIFAENYAEKGLKKEHGEDNVQRVDKLNFGYDIKVELPDGKKMHIEVKGRSSEIDVELTPNETETADNYKDTFYLCVVSPIPKNSAMYMIQNPAAPGIGKKDKLTIPVSIWKSAKWP